jgi:hypothetical protein
MGAKNNLDNSGLSFYPAVHKTMRTFGMPSTKL